jgi:hypothetical protein
MDSSKPFCERKAREDGVMPAIKLPILPSLCFLEGNLADLVA